MTHQTLFLLAVCLIAWLLAGCAGLPRHADGTALVFVAPTTEELQEHGPVELPYYVAGAEVFSAEPAGPEGGGEDHPLWALLIGVAVAAFPALNIVKSALTASGRANWSVIGSRRTSWAATVASVMHNTVGTSSPPEAIVERAQAEPAMAAVADTRMPPAAAQPA